MRTVPSVSILREKVVVVRGIHYEPLVHEGEMLTPEKTLELLGERYAEVFVMDIDGIQYNAPQLDLIGELSNVCDIWLDAGARTSESVMDLFVAGATRAVLATKTVISMAEYAKAAELSADVIGCIDADSKGIVSVHRSIYDRSLEDAIDAVAASGIDILMLADLRPVNNRKPLKPGLLRRLSGKARESIVGGHLPSDELRTLEECGVSVAVIDLERALSLQAHEPRPDRVQQDRLRSGTEGAKHSCPNAGGRPSGGERG